MVLRGAVLAALAVGAGALRVAQERQGPRALVRRAGVGTDPLPRLLVTGVDADDALDGDVRPHFHHIAKTGISAVMALLRAALNSDDPTAWDYSDAFMGQYRKKPGDFYIGAVRNPCNYYVSLWAYNAEHHGVGQLVKELALQGAPSDFLNTSEGKGSEDDIRKFREFVSFIQGEIGVYTGRLAFGFIPHLNDSGVLSRNFSTRWLDHARSLAVLDGLERFDTSEIDCWVATETLIDDMNECMAILSKQHGWTVHWGRYNDTKSNMTRNPSKHEACKHYYDDKTEQLVRGKDRAVFEKFGFDSCCDAGSKLATHLASHTYRSA